MNKERLLKMADFIEKLKPAKLDMSVVAILNNSETMHPNKCDSAGCLMGWTPAVFPALMEWEYNKHGVFVKHKRRKDLYDREAMIELFDLRYQDVLDLFNSGRPGYRTPKQVANGIRKFVRTGVMPSQIIGYDSPNSLSYENQTPVIRRRL